MILSNILFTQFSFITRPCSSTGLFLAARPQGLRGRDLPQGPRGRDLPQGPRGRGLPQGPRGARRDSKKTGLMQYMEAALRGPDGNL